MIKNIGIDIGTITTVYTSNKKTGVIESRLEPATEINKLSGSNLLKTKDKEFLVSEGKFENNIFKFRKDIFVNLLHYAVADATTDNSNVNIVIGIPVKQFTPEYKKELASIIRSNKVIDVRINNKLKRATIEKILIRPESYGVFKLFEAENKIIKNVPSVVIDIGGGTTDISFYNAQGQFKTGTSINTGLLNYYNLIKDRVFNKYNFNMSVEQAKEYTRNNFRFIGLEKNFEADIKENFFKTLYNEIIAEYEDINKYNVILAGGGAELLEDHFKNKINHLLVDKDITTNAKTFYQIANQEF